MHTLALERALRPSRPLGRSRPGSAQLSPPLPPSPRPPSSQGMHTAQAQLSPHHLQAPQTASSSRPASPAPSPPGAAGSQEAAEAGYQTGGEAFHAQGQEARSPSPQLSSPRQQRPQTAVSRLWDQPSSIMQGGCGGACYPGHDLHACLARLHMRFSTPHVSTKFFTLTCSHMHTQHPRSSAVIVGLISNDILQKNFGVPLHVQS